LARSSIGEDPPASESREPETYKEGGGIPLAMARFAAPLYISVIVGTALLLGCISGEKAMDVKATVEDWASAEIDGHPNFKITVEVSAKNTGDSGYATIRVDMYDDLDEVFANASKRIHLDSGETKNFTVVVEADVDQDFDREAIYPLAAVERLEED